MNDNLLGAGWQPVLSAKHGANVIFKFCLRVTLVAIAAFYILSQVSGVHLYGSTTGAIVVSLLFNLFFVLIEWLLDVIVIGINIGTLGIGSFFTRFLRLITTALAPSAALYATFKLFPKFLQIANYYPSAVVAGLVLGGLLWTLDLPADKK